MQQIDYGPAYVRDARGNLRTWGGAAEVEIAERPDPSQPERNGKARTVRGARRYDGVEKMFGAGSLEHIVVERFRADCATAAGSRIAVETGGGGSGYSPSGYGIPDRQVDAQTRARAAWQAFGRELVGVVAWVLLGNGSLNSYAAHSSMAKGKVREQFGDAITALIEHYDVVDGPRKSA